VIFDIEREINGLSVEERLSARRSRIVPLDAGLEDWMRAERARLSRHADARDYANIARDTQLLRNCSRPGNPVN
jgi:hypothetical protein